MCDVCGRTLLRGERADVWLNGADRRSVCELCKTRALHEGWVREGAVPAFENDGNGSDRRRSLFARLRARQRETEPPESIEPLPEENGARYAPGDGIVLTPTNGNGETATPDLASGFGEAPTRRRPVTGGRRTDPTRRTREPRHVRAVPSSTAHKIAAAVDIFNGSEHRRTVSGVSRSLGEPAVAIAPVPEQPSLVNIVIAWELCWYRYDVDLSESEPGVRLSGQGYELAELEPAERQPNALASAQGELSLP